MVKSLHRSFVAAALVAALAVGMAAPVRAAESGPHAAWMDWQPGNDVTNTASLQRGAANFMATAPGVTRSSTSATRAWLRI